MGRGSSKLGGKRGGGGQPKASSQPAVRQPNPDELVRLVRANSDDPAIRRGVYGLRDRASTDVHDDDALRSDIAKTLQKADSAEGVAKTWFSQPDARNDILRVLGNGYEFVELTNSTRGSMFGIATAKIKSWRLRKKQG